MVRLLDFPNADVIISGKTLALIGDHAVIYGKNLTIAADSNKNLINIVQAVEYLVHLTQ